MLNPALTPKLLSVILVLSTSAVLIVNGRRISIATFLLMGYISPAPMDKFKKVISVLSSDRSLRLKPAPENKNSDNNLGFNAERK